MKVINKRTIDELSNEAQNSSRLRKNLNYHEELSDTLQRLLNAMEPDTYVQPHKHESPDKREFFIILRGKALVIIFKEDGEIEDHIILDRDTENFGVEIPPKKWHTIIVLKKNTVLFEVKDGPYNQMSDKDFAKWAPDEKSPQRFDYNRSILDKLGFNHH